MKSVRLPVLVTVAALGAALALAAFARMGRAAEDLWQTDFKAAQAKAKGEKKYLLVDFTGSDWCGWCIKLHNEVFDKESFKTVAPKQFVLVELDFPQQKKQADELKKQNKELYEKYNIEGFPTVLVMDPEGQVIARTGYREGGPEKYLEQLADFSKIYQNILALKAKLEKSKGLDRAKLLDGIIEGYDKLSNEVEEIPVWSKEIIALDPDNKAGLKVKYDFRQFLTEAASLKKAGKFDEAKAVLDKALALSGVSGELRQKGYAAEGECFFHAHHFIDLVACLQKGVEAAPNSSEAKDLKSTIARFRQAAEAQEAADKLEAGLAKSEGTDRAKLLDKLIDAKKKLTPFDPTAGKDIAKWTKEIITLDADNKAGLKKKYQFKAALDDAEELIRAGKSDEANTALDKALETAGISGDEVQQVQLHKAQLAFMQQDKEQGIVHLKKALEASPKGEFAPRIQMMLNQLEKAKTPATKPAAKRPADE